MHTLPNCRTVKQTYSEYSTATCKPGADRTQCRMWLEPLEWETALVKFTRVVVHPHSFHILSWHSYRTSHFGFHSLTPCCTSTLRIKRTISIIVPLTPSVLSTTTGTKYLWTNAWEWMEKPTIGITSYFLWDV